MATVLIPITLVLLFNTMCLLAIAYTLIFKTNNVANSKPMDNKVRFRIIFGFIVLFGITWVIGFFVISNDIIIFQYIFCSLSCCNGLYVFFFYGIRVKKNRWAWCKLLKCQTLKEIQRLYTKKNQMNTYDASSPMFVNSIDSANTSSSLLKFLAPKGNGKSLHPDSIGSYQDKDVHPGTSDSIGSFQDNHDSLGKLEEQQKLTSFINANTD